MSATTRSRYVAEYAGDAGYGVWDRNAMDYVGDFYEEQFPTSRKAAQRYAQWLNEHDRHHPLGPTAAGLPAGGVRREGIDS